VGSVDVICIITAVVTCEVSGGSRTGTGDRKIHQCLVPLLVGHMFHVVLCTDYFENEISSTFFSGYFIQESFRIEILKNSCVVLFYYTQMV